MPVRPPTFGEILRARATVENAMRFLRGGKESEIHLIEADLLFESGALHAIDWMLGLPEGEWFLRHLDGLRRIEDKLIEEAGHAR